MNNLVKVENGNITVAEELVNKIISFEKESLKMKMIADDLKAKIKTAMEENGIDKGFSIETEEGSLKVSYRKPTTRTTLDSKKLKEELPDIYEEYSKTSEVSSSISIKVEC